MLIVIALIEKDFSGDRRNWFPQSQPRNLGVTSNEKDFQYAHRGTSGIKCRNYAQ